MSAAGVTKPNRSSPMPLWAQVLDDMHRRLASGEFADGFPPERELVAQYAISRHTMRDVMGKLDSEGLIERERGRGTFMRERAIEQRTGALYSLFRSIEECGFEQRSTVITLDQRTDVAVAEKLALASTTRFVYLHRLRKADATPIATDELWLPMRLAKALLSVDFEHTAVYTELEQRCGVRPGAGWERVHPVLPSQDERAQLGIGAREPAFLVERYTTFEGKPLEWRRTVIRGDLYTFLTTWNETGTPLDRPSFAPAAPAAEIGPKGFNRLTTPISRSEEAPESPVRA